MTNGPLACLMVSRILLMVDRRFVLLSNGISCLLMVHVKVNDTLGFLMVHRVLIVHDVSNCYVCFIYQYTSNCFTAFLCGDPHQGHSRWRKENGRERRKWYLMNLPSTTIPNQKNNTNKMPLAFKMLSENYIF